MKRHLKLLNSLIVATAFILLAVRCGKDEGAKYSKVTGTVSLADGTMADGAIVFLSTTPNAANIIGRTITDAVGMYSFVGIENGTYYLNARYEPSNNNNLLKGAGTVVLTGTEQEIKVSGDLKADIEMAGALSSGTASFNSEDWVWDNTHSTIEFEFPYDAVNAVFKGHFALAGVDELIFDEQDPASTSIKAWVDLTSVETGAASPPGEHGRDGITGCIVTSFKVQKDATDTVDVYASDGTLITNWPNEDKSAFDLWGDGSYTSYEKQSAIIGNSGVATFEASEVTAYGTGYAAAGTFTFAGVSKEVTLYFNYLEGYTNTDNTKKYVSFYGWFKFAAKADFGISSSHVGDAEITVKVSAQFNQTL